MMMTFVYRAEDDWIGWPSRELLPAGRCCDSNKCHERTAIDLSSNLQTLTMVNHQKSHDIAKFQRSVDCVLGFGMFVVYRLCNLYNILC